MAALAMLDHGIDPDEKVMCGGGYRLGNRVFKCLGRHGPMDMRSAIMKSCNTYFYAMGNRIGYDAIAPTAKLLGLGQEFPLPFQSQRYGTIPDSAWKMRKYGDAWTRSDTLNATIGQGYVITSPFQLAVMAARIASGSDWMLPYLARLLDDPYYAVRIVAARSLRSLPSAPDLAVYDELMQQEGASAIARSAHDAWQAPQRAQPEILLDGRGMQWDTFRRLYARRDDRVVFLAE
jgi:hypothetical protein